MRLYVRSMSADVIVTAVIGNGLAVSKRTWRSGGMTSNCSSDVVLWWMMTVRWQEDRSTGADDAIVKVAIPMSAKTHRLCTCTVAGRALETKSTVTMPNMTRYRLLQRKTTMTVTVAL